MTKPNNRKAPPRRTRQGQGPCEITVPGSLWHKLMTVDKKNSVHKGREYVYRFDLVMARDDQDRFIRDPKRARLVVTCLDECDTVTHAVLRRRLTIPRERLHRQILAAGSFGGSVWTEARAFVLKHTAPSWLREKPAEAEGQPDGRQDSEP